MVEVLKWTIEKLYRMSIGKYLYIQIHLTDPLKPVKLPMPEVPRCLSNFNPEINMDFEENSLFQEGVVLGMYQKPDKSCLQEPQELDSLSNAGRLVQKYSLQQTNIDKNIKDYPKKHS